MRGYGNPDTEVPSFAEKIGRAGVESGSAAVDFRVAQYPDGRKLVQGAYPVKQGFATVIDWRPLPMVLVNESGKAIE